MTLSRTYLTTALQVAQMRVSGAPLAEIHSYLICQGYYNIRVTPDFAEGMSDGVMYEF